MDLSVGLPGSGADRIVTGAAQDVINGALADVGASGGGTVMLMPGVYSVTSGVQVAADHVALVGSGRDQTVIQAAPGYPVLSSPIVSITGVEDVEVEDLTVDGHTNDAQTNGIVATQSSSVSIADCGVLLSSNWNYGIWLVQSHDVQVERNIVDGIAPTPDQEGIETWNSSDVLIADNHVLNIGSNGINLISGPTTLDGDISGEDGNITVTRNTVERSLQGVSVLLAGPRTFDGITITDNVLRDLVGSGVQLSNYAAMSDAPADESATLAHPQELSDVLIEGNAMSFDPTESSLFGGAWFGRGVSLENLAAAGLFSASGIVAQDNDITGGVVDFYSEYYPSGAVAVGEPPPDPGTTSPPVTVTPGAAADDTGPPGPVDVGGSQGATVDAGAIGAQDPAGAAGSQGATGLTSATGTQDAQGDTGTADASGSAEPTAPAPMVTLDPAVQYRRGALVLTGTAAGVGSVELSTTVDGAAVDLGSARVRVDGSFTFRDRVGASTQEGITARANDGSGASATVVQLLTGGLGGPYHAEQDLYDQAGEHLLSRTLFGPGGDRVDVAAPRQSVDIPSNGLVVDHGRAGTRFVFSPGDGQAVVGGFVVAGQDHSVLELPASDFTSFADVLRRTSDGQGNAVVTDPATGDSVRLAGVSKAELRSHPADFTLY